MESIFSEACDYKKNKDFISTNNINSNGMSFNSMNNILVDPTGMES